LYIAILGFLEKRESEKESRIGHCIRKVSKVLRVDQEKKK
jgi:hypothetical protein